MASNADRLSPSAAFWRDMIDAQPELLVERISLGDMNLVAVSRLITSHDTWHTNSFVAAGVLCLDIPVRSRADGSALSSADVCEAIRSSSDAWKLMNPTGWISITRFVPHDIDNVANVREIKRGAALETGESHVWHKDSGDDATIYLDRFSENKSQRSLHLLLLWNGIVNVVLIPIRQHTLLSLCRECYLPRDVIDVCEKNLSFITGECESCGSDQQRQISLNPLNKRMMSYVEAGSIIVMVAYDMEQVIETMIDKRGDMTLETDVSSCRDGGLGLTVNITASISVHAGKTEKSQLTREERVGLLEQFRFVTETIIARASSLFAIATARITTNNAGDNDCLDVSLLMDVRSFANTERAICMDMAQREEWNGVIATRPLEQVFADIVLDIHSCLESTCKYRGCNGLVYCHAWNGDKWDNVFFSPALIDQLRAKHGSLRNGKIPALNLTIGNARRIVAINYEPKFAVARGNGAMITVGLGVGDTMKLYGAIVPLRSVAKNMNVLQKGECPFALVNDCYRGRVRPCIETKTRFLISPTAIEQEWARGKDIEGRRVYTPYGLDEDTWKAWRDANLDDEGLIDIYKSVNDYCLIDTKILPIVIKMGVIDGSKTVLDALASFLRQKEGNEEKARLIESLDVLLIRCLTSTTAGATLVFGQLLNTDVTVVTPSGDGFKQAFTQTAFGGMCTVTKQGMFMKQSLVERFLACLANARHFGALPSLFRLPFVHVFKDEDRLVTLDISGAYGQAMCENMPKGPFRRVNDADLRVMEEFVLKSRGNFAASRKKPFNFGTFVVECLPPAKSFWPRMSNFVPIPFKLDGVTVWEKQPYVGLMNLHHIAIAARWGYSIKFFEHPLSFVCDHENAWPLARDYGQTLEKLKQSMESQANGDSKSPFMIIRTIIKNLANSFCGKMGQRAQNHIDSWHIGENIPSPWLSRDMLDADGDNCLLRERMTEEEAEQACLELNRTLGTPTLHAPMSSAWHEPLAEIGEIELAQLAPVVSREEENKVFKAKLRHTLRAQIKSRGKTFNVSSTCVVTRRKKRGIPPREGMIWNFSKITSRTHEMIGEICATVDELIPAGTRSYQTWCVGQGLDLLHDISNDLPIECFPTSFARDTDSCHAILSDSQYAAFMELHGVKNADGSRRQATYDATTDVMRMFTTDETSGARIDLAFYVGKKFYGLFETKSIEKVLNKLESLANVSIEDIHPSVKVLHVLAIRLTRSLPPTDWNDKLTMAKNMIANVSDEDILAHLETMKSCGFSNETICSAIVSWSCRPLKTTHDMVRELIAEEMYATLVTCRPYKSACKGANTKQVSLHTFLCALGLSFPSDMPAPAQSFTQAELATHHARVQAELAHIAKLHYSHLPSGERERRTGYPVTWRVAFTTTSGVKAAKFMLRRHMRPAVPHTGRITVTGDVIPNGTSIINNLLPTRCEVQASAHRKVEREHAQSALKASIEIAMEEESR